MVTFYDIAMNRDISYHIDKKILRYLDDKVKPLIQKKDKDFPIAIDGYEGCLTGDTQIQVSRFKLSRRYPIERLYKHFQRIGYKGKFFDLNEPSKVRSFNGKEIRLHKIKDVTYSGKKQVFLLELEDNKSIKATANHKFLTKEGWKPLEQLTKGIEIMCDKLKSSGQNRKRIKLYDIALNINNHPYMSPKKRVEVHKLIYEARLNNLEFTEYLDILLNEPEKAKQLKFINPSIYSIHHKDGCHYNNSIDNLKLMKKEEHLEYHGNNNYDNFNQGIPQWIRIKNVIKLGIEDTYDIECEKPHHNFVANGIVVHNSGKSTFAQQLGKYVDPSLDLSRICMTADEFKMAIINAKPFQCVIYDEAVTGMTAGDTISRIGKLLKSMMMQMRQKNLFVIVIIPSIFELNRYAVLSRIRTFFHVYESKGRMGYFVGYNRRDTRRLFLKGKKSYSYKVRSNFRGRFYGKYVIDEQAYRKKKADALFLIEDGEKDEKGRIYWERKILLVNFVLFCKKHLKIPQYQVIEMLKEGAGFKTDATNFSKSMEEVRKRGNILEIKA